MLEELQRRNYSHQTIRDYLRAVAQFAKHFGKRPDQLGPDELRTYQAYLLRERKLAVGSVVAQVAALRFFYVRTLKRHEFREDLPYPKDHRRLPTVLSLEEVARLINAAGNLQQRALLMTLYGTGMRRTEVSLLKVSDIDSQRMMIRVERGKGGAGRDIPLSPALLETLAGILALEKTPHLSVPEQRTQTRQGTTHFRQDRVVRLYRSRSPRGPHQAHQLLIVCATASPPTCWRAGRICAPFRSYWVTAIWKRRRNTCICPNGICAPSPIPWRACRFPACRK